MLRTRGVALSAVTVLTLAGCSVVPTSPATPSGATSTPTTPGSGSQTPSSADSKPQRFVRTVRTTLEKAKTYRMTMSMDGSNDAVSLTGSGDITDTAHPKADMTISVSGSRPSRLVVDGQSVFLQIPGNGKFVAIPPSALSQSGGQDLVALAFPNENLRATERAVQRVDDAGLQTVDGQVLHHYTVVLDPALLQNVPSLPTGAAAPTGSATAGGAPVSYDLWLDSANLVRRMTLTLSGRTMTTTLSDFGRPVTIVTPPSQSVTQVPGLSETAPGTASPSAPPASPLPSTTPPSTP